MELLEKIKLRRDKRLLLTLITIIVFTSPLARTHGFPDSSSAAHSHREDAGFLTSETLCGGFIFAIGNGSDPAFQAEHPALGALGGGDITLVYASNFPVEGRSYAQSLFDLVYPEIKKVYGDPSNTITVTLSYDPSVDPWNYYYGATHTIVLSQLPPSGGTSPTWDAIFTHELIHAFHDAIYLTGGSWAEEGMTEAATEIVAMNLQGRRDIVFRDPVINLKYYDVWSYMGSTVLGGGPDFTYKVNPDLSYRTSAAMFFILTAEQSTNLSNPYDFLARLNRVIYSDASSNPFFDDLRFKLRIRQAAAGRLVEGQLADLWVGNQPITTSYVRSGFQLGVYPYRPENPTRVWAITFSRQPDSRETPLGSIQVDIKIIDSTGRTITTGHITTGSDGMGSTDLSQTPMPSGGYEIVASTIFNGINYTSKNYAFSQGESIIIEQADVNVYGVTLDNQGKPVASSVSVIGGTVRLNTQGAFRIEETSQAPPLELTVTSGSIDRKFGKPNPYTRIVWSNSTAAPTTPYDVTVNVNGLPSNYSTNLRVDGASHGTIQGSGTTTLTFNAGTAHTISVDNYNNASSTSRYHCINSLQTVTAGTNLVFNYVAEFYSTFQQSGSPKPISATIDGTTYVLPVGFWWTSGSNHTFTYQSNLTDDSTRYLLTGTSQSPPAIISGTLTVAGFYKTQYILNASTVPAGISALNGSGWHDAGSKVNLVAPTVSGYNFQNWIVDNVQIPGNPIQLDMNSPHKAVAQYQSLGIYDVTVAALHLNTNELTEATFTWDGQTFATPHTFTGVSGNHNLIMASNDKQGRSFARWQDSTSNMTSRTVSAGGTYTALFGVLTKDFTLTITPEHQRIGPGQSTSFTVKVDSPSGFSSPVTLGIRGLPVNSKSAFNPQTFTPPGTSTLVIDTQSTTLVGSYILTITATGDGQIRKSMVRLSMGACIIATATYGSELSPEVQFLRGFRDNTVRRTFAGESFMMAFNIWYYSFSPTVADFVASNNHAKTIVKAILYPLMLILHTSSWVYTFFTNTPEIGVFVSGAAASFLIGAVYCGPVLAALILTRNKVRMYLWRLSILIISGSVVLSLMGEITQNMGLMMVGTAAFVIGTLTSAVPIWSKILNTIFRIKSPNPDSL